MGKTERGFPTADAPTVFSFRPTLSVSVCVRTAFGQDYFMGFVVVLFLFFFFGFPVFFSIFSPLPGKVIFLNYRKMFTLLLVLRLWWYIFQVVPDKVRIPRKQQPIDCESQCKRCKIFSTAPTTLYIVMVWCF